MTMKWTAPGSVGRGQDAAPEARRFAALVRPADAGDGRSAAGEWGRRPGTERRQITRTTCAAALAACALALFAAGCASTRGGDGLSQAELTRILRSQGVEGEVVVPYEVGEEARRWAVEAVPEKGPPGRRLEVLLDRMIDPEGLAIRYQGGFTGTADEVFAAREGNCLGFMNLFIGLGRALGLPVYYVLVEEGQRFGREGDLVVVADHMAAGFGPPHEMLLLDFVVGPPVEYEGLRPVSDLEAVAKHYSNRGAEELLRGGASTALPWLEKAVALKPELATSWVNLGVARRRINDLAGAEQAYRHALELDPKAHSAYQNLAALLRMRGREEEALALLSITDELGSRNPYNYISLGDWNLEAGRPDEARRFYRRALVLHDEDAEPYAALGQLELATGHLRKARRWLRRAAKIDPDHDRVVELEHRLENGGAPL